MPVQMTLSRIIISEINDQQVIYLKEVDGDRTFPILIGIFEATSIDRRVKDHQSPRPLTHDLLVNSVEMLGAEFDSEVSESKLVEDGKVDEAVGELQSRGLLYEGKLDPPKGKTKDWDSRQQTLFRATRYGDQVDRPLRKSDGTWTYFATDIAYHLDKFNRGHREMIDVWGADHGGYIKRMQAAVKAFSDGNAALDVQLCHDAQEVLIPLITFI